MIRLRHRCATNKSFRSAGVSRRSVFSLLGGIALATVTMVLGTGQAHAQEIFVGSNTGNTVIRYNSAGVSQGTFASTGLNAPFQMAFSPINGDLYVASLGSSEIRRYNGTTGAFVQAFSTPFPGGIVFNAAGDFFASNFLAGTITRFSSTGANLGSFSSGTDRPNQMTILANGDLLVSDGTFTSTIMRINGTTFASSVFTTTNLSSPSGMVLGADGRLYVANRNNNSITRYNGVTGAFIDTFSSAGSLNIPQSLAFAPDGRLLVANNEGNNVLAINSVGAQSLFTTITRPIGLVIRGGGTATAPEPGSFALLALGIVGGVVVRCRKA